MMDDLSENDSGQYVNEAKAWGKSYVVIAWLLNNDFGLSQKLIDRPLERDPQTEKADESGSLAMGRDVTLFLEIFKHIFSFLFF